MPNSPGYGSSRSLPSNSLDGSGRTSRSGRRARKDTLRGWGSKLGDKLARVAGLLHAADHRHAPWTRHLTAETMQRALSLADFFLEHYRAFLFDARVDPVSVRALNAVEWIHKGRLTGFKRSDLYVAIAKNAGEGGADLIDHVLKLLESTNHIRRARPVPGRGRTAEAYDVNPKIHGAPDAH